MTIGDGAADHRTNQGVGEIVHPYTMRDDLAVRPEQS
jgi:hypothetical protein